MSSFEIDLTRNKNINIKLQCLECSCSFSTELDSSIEDEPTPHTKDDTLYCTECEASYNYTVRIDFSKFLISFEDDLKGQLNYSSGFNKEEYDESTPYKAKKFYYSQIERLKEIIRLEVKQFITEQAFNRLIYSGVITALETYLNDFFLAIVFKDNYSLEKFVSEYEPYKKEQISLNEIFETIQNINTKVEKDLNYIIYHNISRLIPVFDIYNFDLRKCNEISSISKSIKKRHDFVHRSGQDKNGNFQEVSKSEIFELISTTNGLVQYIDKKYKEKCYDPFGDLPF
ncbi:hypothetical protein [Zhouia amylolytica]|uniref:hypothetical protein n=1 Tax=Zhouia amylolytica TaxID=376730 RepID=UPI0020CE3AF7|nr:hypothetical protein [Zhouia amylolytica]MCQ0110304.1 hypothetical protein [Zhouia amylolytica]